MGQRFTIAEVRFRGQNVPDAIVKFAPGLNVVAGPSNTGKSVIRAAINFVFGSGSPMKAVKEATGYQTVFVQVRTSDGAPITFERSWGGGDIRQYDAAADVVTSTTASTVLSSKHSAENKENISAVLLSLAGFEGIRLRKNQRGELRNLSFRDFVEYVLISEERIITEESPIHTASFTDNPYESSLFRGLLTGQNDAGLIIATPAKGAKDRIAGEEEAIERIKTDIQSRIPKDGRSQEDLSKMVETLDARIAEQSKLLRSYRTDLAALERDRRSVEYAYQESSNRRNEVTGHLKRFDLLNQQYESDLKRLQSTVEAGNLFAGHMEGPCPICGANPQHHQQHGITPEQLENFTVACQAEAEKIQARRADLASTILALVTEQGVLQAGIIGLEKQRGENALAFKNILGASITNIDGDLSELSERRAGLAGTLALYAQLQRLELLELRAQQSRPPKSKRDKSFTQLPPSAYDEFAASVQELLREWSFPELDRVVFDTVEEDIVISGKARKDNGKGYRAITYAAFMIAVLRETVRKELPHPGFVLMDSPLVTYREPDEHMGENVKNAFYKNLASSLGDTQVIILENEEPPDALKESIAFTGFSKNRSVGRYGLFLPLPTHIAQEEKAFDSL